MPINICLLMHFAVTDNRLVHEWDRKMVMTQIRKGRETKIVLHWAKVTGETIPHGDGLARILYLDWWNAVNDNRLELEQRQFRSVALTRWMPPKQPWATVEALVAHRGGG